MIKIRRRRNKIICRINNRTKERRKKEEKKRKKKERENALLKGRRAGACKRNMKKRNKEGDGDKEQVRGDVVVSSSY